MKKRVIRELALIIAVLLIAPLASSGIQWSKESSTSFKTQSGSNPICYIDYPPPNGWYESVGNVIAQSEWTDSDYNCYRDGGSDEWGISWRMIGGVPEEKKECCPADYRCDVGGTETCLQDLSVSKCEGYTNREDCLTDRSNKAVGEAESLPELGPGYCRTYFEDTYGLCFLDLQCKCGWDETEGNCYLIGPRNNICKGNDCKDISFFRTTQGMSDTEVIAGINTFCDTGGTPPPVGDCNRILTDTDECNSTGKLTRSWTAEWTGTGSADDANCMPGSMDIPCSTQLGYFGIAGVIVVIILVIIFYLIFYKKGKRKR